MKKAHEGKAYSEGQVATILEDIRDRFGAFGEGQEVISNQLKETNVSLTRVEDRLSRVEDEVVEIKHGLSVKADREEVQKLEKRVVALEKIVLAKRS